MLRLYKLHKESLIMDIQMPKKQINTSYDCRLPTVSTTNYNLIMVRLDKGGVF